MAKINKITILNYHEFVKIFKNKTLQNAKLTQNIIGVAFCKGWVKTFQGGKYVDRDFERLTFVPEF